MATGQVDFEVVFTKRLKCHEDRASHVRTVGQRHCLDLVKVIRVLPLFLTLMTARGRPGPWAHSTCSNGTKRPGRSPRINFNQVFGRGRGRKRNPTVKAKLRPEFQDFDEMDF